MSVFSLTNRVQANLEWFLVSRFRECHVKCRAKDSFAPDFTRVFFESAVKMLCGFLIINM